jgi:hypothetical protein
MILGVLDLSVVIAAIVTIFKPARELLRIMNSLPPIIRALVIAIIAFVMIVLIIIIVMVVWMWISALFPGIAQLPLFAALFLARFIMWVGMPFQMLLQRCMGSSAWICTWLFTRFFPNLPTWMCGAGITVDILAGFTGTDGGGAGADAGCQSHGPTKSRFSGGDEFETALAEAIDEVAPGRVESQLRQSSLEQTEHREVTLT